MLHTADDFERKDTITDRNLPTIRKKPKKNLINTKCPK